MADERVYDSSGQVVSGYLTPDEAREAGVAWAPRPNEPAPYRTEDESREEGTAYVPEAQHYEAVGGNYNYWENIDRFRVPVASSITTLGATEGARQTPTVGPVGLAYPDDPVNYATMQYNPASGYNGLQSGIYPSGGAAPALAIGAAPAGGGMIGGMSQTTVLLLLGAAAVAGYFLLVKS